MKFSEAWLAAIHNHCLLPQNQRILIHPNVSKNLHQITSKKRAAVLIPLCNRHGKASFLFTVRTSTVGTHKGQVSFPGGHIDLNEEPIDTAIRETYEELGNDIGKIRILGTCQTIPAITGTLVTPVIGFLEDDVNDFEKYQPSVNEVDLIFTKTLEELTAPGYKEFEVRSRNGVSLTMPVFGSQEKNRIWGLTATILDPVLSNVVLPLKTN